MMSSMAPFITKALTDDPDLQKNCDAAIAGIEKVVSPLSASQSPGRTQSGKSSTSNRFDEEMKEYNERVAQLQAKKDQIIKEGNEKAEKIRKETQAQIDQETSVTMFTSRDPVTGERKPTLPTYRRDYIFEIGEEEAKKVLNDAEARARGIQIPSPPLPR